MNNVVFNNNIKALIIGVSKFQDKFIADVPNIKQNVKQLKQVLSDNENKVVVSLNEKKNRILRKLYGLYLDADKDDTVFIYYSGHGLINPDDNQVYLTATDTTVEFMEHDGISVQAIYQLFVKIKAKRKVLVIDACNSGKIMDYASDNDFLKSQNVYIITSASKNSPAYYPVDNPDVPTYFTGAFVDILTNGLSGYRKYIKPDEIYGELYKYSLSKRLPRPKLFAHGSFRFVENNKAKFNSAVGSSYLNKINFYLLNSVLRLSAK